MTLFTARSARPQGFVYFIGPDWHHKLIKIGYTKKHPKGRLSELQTGCPFDLKLHAFMEGGPDLERAFHETFAPVRLRGEWFQIKHKLLSVLAYFDYSGIECRPVTDDEFEAMMHDVIRCDEPPHPSVNVDEWIDSADGGVLSSWECDRAWAEYQASGRG